MTHQHHAGLRLHCCFGWLRALVVHHQMPDMKAFIIIQDAHHRLRSMFTHVCYDQLLRMVKSINKGGYTQEDLQAQKHSCHALTVAFFICEGSRVVCLAPVGYHDGVNRCRWHCQAVGRQNGC